MSPAPEPAKDDPGDSLEVRASLRFLVVSLVGGLIGVSLGLVLELFLYRRFELSLRDFPFRINGWWFVAFGGVFVWIGARGLIARPTLLRLDSLGLHSPKQWISIPWDQIQEVRRVVLGGGGGRYLSVLVASVEEIPGAKSNRLKYWAVRDEFGQDEVPIAMTGGDMSLESAVSAVEARLARWRSGSNTSVDAR